MIYRDELQPHLDVAVKINLHDTTVTDQRETND